MALLTKVKHKRTGTPAAVPTISDIEIGELAINYADQKLFSANSSAVFELGGGSSTPMTRVYQAYTATASQTTFTVTSGYDVGYIDVYVNGVKLAADEYTQDGADVVLDVGAILNSIVEVVGYKDVDLESVVAAPGGSDTHVQYNDATVLNGSAGFTFTKGTNNVTIANTLLVGANSSLGTVRLVIGNSTINSYANSIYLNVGGRTTFAGEVARFSANTDEIPVPAAYLQVGVQNFNSNTTASGDVCITSDTGNDTVQYIDLGINSSTYNDPAFSIGGALAGYLYTSNNDLTIGTKSTANLIFHVGGGQANNEIMRLVPSVGMVMTPNTTVSYTILVGNSTINTLANSTLVKVHNATASANLGPGLLTVGTSVVNTTVIAAGANVLIGTVNITIGNSTVNTVSNSIVQIAANSTVSSAFGIGGANCGANVLIGTINITIGNSTVNSVSNSLGLYLANSTTVSNLTSSQVSVGANAFLSTITLSIGNTTANLFANSILFKLANSTSTANLSPVALTIGSTVVNSTVIVSGGSLLSANIQTNPQTGTTYTLVAADSGKLVTCNNASAITVTVPAGLPIGFRTMVMQYGAGNVTISNTGQTGALIFSRNSLFVSTAKYGTVSVMQPAANDYIIDGAI